MGTSVPGTVVAVFIVLLSFTLQLDEAVFKCPRLFHEHSWHHIVVVINKGMRGRAKVTLFIDAQSQETRKVGG